MSGGPLPMAATIAGDCVRAEQRRATSRTGHTRRGLNVPPLGGPGVRLFLSAAPLLLLGVQGPSMSVVRLISRLASLPGAGPGGWPAGAACCPDRRHC